MTRTLACLLLSALIGAPLLAADAVTTPAGAQTVIYKKGAKPLRGRIYYGRRGGYSYKSNDTVSRAEASRFWDPGVTRQTTNGPFDNGFFFDSAVTRGGGDAPYQH